jgi:hypothetical protein
MFSDYGIFFKKYLLISWAGVCHVMVLTNRLENLLDIFLKKEINY